MNEQESKAVVRLCILAAFADGQQAEAERAQVQRVVAGFSGERPDLGQAYQDVLAGNLKLADAARDLQSPEAKALGYEMTVCVCNADGVLNEQERQFLDQVRSALQLEADAVSAHEQKAQALIEQPVATPLPPVVDSGRDTEVDRMILNAAILNGALELMPQTLATMAIVPLQMRLVYQVGRRYGYELDRGHIKDFLATAGVGLSSQVVEGYASRLIGGLARQLGGRLLGGLAAQATGSAFAFASTYALGQVAKRYYAGGRLLSANQLKEVFSSMLQDGRSMQGRYAGEIAEKAQHVNLSQLL